MTGCPILAVGLLAFRHGNPTSRKRSETWGTWCDPRSERLILNVTVNGHPFLENLSQNGKLAAMGRIAQEEVRVCVQRFWSILAGQSKDPFEELYSPEATVITGKAKSSERAPLAIARRKREIARHMRDASFELGPIDVEIADDNVAIASYTYKFLRVLKQDNREGQIQRHTPYGRATHVFQRDFQGAFRIVHEHLSSAVAGSSEPPSRS